MTERGHSVFSLVNPKWVTAAVRQDPAAVSLTARHGLERTLDLAAWLEIYRPRIAVAAAGSTSATPPPRGAA